MPFPSFFGKASLQRLPCCARDNSAPITARPPGAAVFTRLTWRFQDTASLSGIAALALAAADGSLGVHGNISDEAVVIDVVLAEGDGPPARPGKRPLPNPQPRIPITKRPKAIPADHFDSPDGRGAVIDITELALRVSQASAARDLGWSCTLLAKKHKEFADHRWPWRKYSQLCKLVGAEDSPARLAQVSVCGRPGRDRGLQCALSPCSVQLRREMSELEACRILVRMRSRRQFEKAQARVSRRAHIFVVDSSEVEAQRG